MNQANYSVRAGDHAADVRLNRISRVVIGSGQRRYVFSLASAREDRRAASMDLKRFLFPTNPSYHKAKRRGERALSMYASARSI